MRHGIQGKDAAKRTSSKVKMLPNQRTDPRAAFETSAKLGLVRKALRQS